MSCGADGRAGPSEQGEADAQDVAATENSPFSVPAVQAGDQISGAARLPGSPRLSGSAEPQPTRSNATQTAMDHKRAFQAVNAETLELASQDINYELPPQRVCSICLLFELLWRAQVCTVIGRHPHENAIPLNRIPSLQRLDLAISDLSRSGMNVLQIQDRIGFLINNLSNSNLSQKAGELKGYLTEEYWLWFCNYMVVKRAAQEQNYHLLYVNLLQNLQVAVHFLLYQSQCQTINATSQTLARRLVLIPP